MVFLVNVSDHTRHKFKMKTSALNMLTLTLHRLASSNLKGKEKGFRFKVAGSR